MASRRFVFFLLMIGLVTIGMSLLVEPGTAAGIATAQESASSPTPLTFGEAHITVPAGWKHAERQAGASKILMMNPPDITEKKKLVVYLLPGKDLQGADFPQVFDAVVKAGVGANEHLVKYSEVPARKADGYDMLTRMLVVDDAAGHRSVRICFGANPKQRLHMLVVTADSQETIKHYEAAITSMLGSYSFSDAAVAGDTQKDESGATQAQAGKGSSVSGNTASGPKTGVPGKRVRVREDESVLLCTDPARLDFAMDAAKNGNSYDASRALRFDYFFRVTGPAMFEIRDSDLKSRWPKVFVKVLDGNSAGKTGWVLVSELKDLK